MYMCLLSINLIGTYQITLGKEVGGKRQTGFNVTASVSKTLSSRADSSYNLLPLPEASRSCFLAQGGRVISNAAPTDDLVLPQEKGNYSSNLNKRLTHVLSINVDNIWIISRFTRIHHNYVNIKLHKPLLALPPGQTGKYKTEGYRSQGLHCQSPMTYKMN